MSVVIVNMTGNRCGFEDRLCAELELTVTVETQSRSARGVGAFQGALALPVDCRVLVVVAHAGQRPDKSVRIHMGIQPPCEFAESLADDCREASCPDEHCTHAKAVRMIESPMVLSDMISANSPYVLVFYSCEALAPDTMASTFRNPHCLGIVGSPCKPSDLDVERVAKIVDDLDAAVASGVADGKELRRIVQHAVNSTAGDVSFCFSETMRVTEE